MQNDLPSSLVARSSHGRHPDYPGMRSIADAVPRSFVAGATAVLDLMHSPLQPCDIVLIVPHDFVSQPLILVPTPPRGSARRRIETLALSSL
jgi:hypothetical protein